MAVVLCNMCYMAYIKEREVAVLLTRPELCHLLNAVQHKHLALTYFSLFPQNVVQDIIQFYTVRVGWFHLSDGKSHQNRVSKHTDQTTCRGKELRFPGCGLSLPAFSKCIFEPKILFAVQYPLRLTYLSVVHNDMDYTF
jgi:hypothetical protein